jgi:hypothetical protein
VRRVLSRAGVLAWVGVLLVVTPVAAAWLQSATATSTFSTTTLAAPTGLSATRGCTLTVRHASLSWTATTSSWATGYVVWRKAGNGAFTQLATVPSRLTTTYLDLGLAASTAYTYYVTTTYQSWTAASTQQSVTTEGLLCL